MSVMRRCDRCCRPTHGTGARVALTFEAVKPGRKKRQAVDLCQFCVDRMNANFLVPIATGEEGFPVFGVPTRPTTRR